MKTRDFTAFVHHEVPDLKKSFVTGLLGPQSYFMLGIKMSFTTFNVHFDTKYYTMFFVLVQLVSIGSLVSEGLMSEQIRRLKEPILKLNINLL